MRICACFEGVREKVRAPLMDGREGRKRRGERREERGERREERGERKDERQVRAER